MAQTIKLKRSGTQGAAPTTSNLALGEVAINTYDGKMYIKKSVGGTESIVEIGGSGTGSVSYLEAGMIEYEYTATSNQTTFSGSDSNSATLSYTANSIMVFLNGVLQDDGVDYTATNGTSVVFTSALTANDEVRIVAFTNVTTTSSLQNPTKLDAITTVNGQAAYSLTVNSSAYTPSSQNALIVSLNGITQEPGDSFTISGSTITFSPALVTGDVVDYIVDMGRAVTIGQYDSDLVVSGELEVTGDIIGDLRGAILFKAQAGENLTKCDAVYISGISGNTTVVSKADADDAAKMPAFGIVAASATSGQPVDIYTFGTLSSVDTSTPGWSIGDELYVSTTPGVLTNSAPTGESGLIQKIAKVTRVDNSAGSIKIMGAGRSNATPNLDDGDIFIGNASNQAVTAALDTSIVPENGNLYFTTARVDSHLSGGTGVTYNTGEISIGQDVSTTATPTFGNITTTGYIAGPSTFTIDPAAVGDNTGTLVVAGNLQVDGTTTTINSTTMTVDDLNITVASGAANAAAANGAGITVDGASATLTYNGTNDDWNFNKTLNVDVGAPASSDQVLGRFSSQNGIRDIGFVWDDSQSTLGIATLTNHALVFHTNGNSNERMRIDAGGSVLIGKTTPTDLHNTWNHLIIGEKGAIISQNGAGGIAGIFVADNVYIDDATGTYAYQESAAASFIRQTGGEITFNNAASGTAGAAATLTERMRIAADGRTTLKARTDFDDILIGTGAGKYVQVTGSSGNAWTISSSGGASTPGTASTSFGLHHWNGSAWSEKFTVGTDGNVGIAENTPTHALHVKGDVSDTIDETKGTLKLQGTTGGNGLIFGTTASSPFTSYIQSAYVVDTSLAQYALALNPIGGNVGIGTTYPDTKLHVSGGINTGPASAGSTGAALIVSNADDAYGIHMNVSGSTGTGFISAQRNDGTATTYNLSLNPNGGNVGIGTSTPSTYAKLHVEGDVKMGARQALYLQYSQNATWVKIYERHYLSSSFNYGQQNLLITQSGATNGHGSTARLYVNTKQQSTGDHFDIQYQEVSGEYDTDIAYYYDASGGDSSAGILTIWAKKSAQYMQLSVSSDATGATDKYNSGQLMAVDTGSATQPANSTLIQPNMRLLPTGQGISLERVAGQNAFDVIANATTIANNGTVDFPYMSGMIVINNWNTGDVSLWLVGGGATTRVSSTQSGYGTMSYVSGIGGYRWTNNTGVSRVMTFTAIRTRNTA